MALQKSFILFLLISVLFSADIFGQSAVPDSLEIEANIGAYTKKLKRYRSDPSFKYMTYLDSMLQTKEPVPKPVVNVQKPQPKENSGLSNFWESNITRLFFWILALVFVGAILYRLLVNIKFRRNRDPSYNLEESENGQELNAAGDYGPSISEAEGAGNYSEAIRYLYLWSLSHLQEIGWLQFDRAKTNADYIAEIGDVGIRKEFARLTTTFERVWFGRTSPSDVEYQTLKEPFVNFNTSL